MVPRAVLIISSVVLLLAVIVAQASQEDFDAWNLEDYEPYDKKADQLALADLLTPIEKRMKLKYIRRCFSEGKVCTCDMRYSSSSGRRYSDCKNFREG